MVTYSGLNGTVPISPASSGVWKIEKKSKADDRKERNEKKKSKKERDVIELEENSALERPQNDEGDEINPEFEGQIGYGSLNRKKRVRRKIDLII